MIPKFFWVQKFHDSPRLVRMMGNNGRWIFEPYVMCAGPVRVHGPG